MAGQLTTTRPDARERLRVLYVRGKRARWWPLLTASPCLAVAEVAAGPAALWSLVATARRFRPDVILSEYSGARHLPLLPLRALTGRPLAVAVKGDPWLEAADRRRGGRPRDRLAAVLNRWSSERILRRADLLLPLTPALERTVTARLGERSRRVVPIPFTEPAPGEPASGFGRFLLTVTNFRFRAKVEPLVAAARRLGPVLEEADLTWRILGDGPWLGALREQLAPWPRIRLCGFREVAPWYRAATLFVYPSGLDGLPNVVLEAALHRLAIVVNRGSAAAELVADGETGRVVDFTGAAAAATVRDLVADGDSRGRLGGAAAAWVRRSYAPERVAGELEAALEGLAEATLAPRDRQP